MSPKGRGMPAPRPRVDAGVIPKTQASWVVLGIICGWPLNLPG